MAEEVRQREIWLKRIKHWSELVLLALATKLTRMLMISVAILILGWLAYESVWVTLQGEVEAPSGIPLQAPAIDVELLQEITDDRIERDRHVPQAFPVYDRLFPVVEIEIPPASP